MTASKWNWDIPEFFNIGAACTQKFMHSDKPAIIVENDITGTSSISYEEINHSTNRLASALQSIGIDHKDRVLIRLPNCIEYPVSFLSILKIGAVAVPTSTLLTHEEIEYLANDSGAKAIIIPKSAWFELQPSIEQCPTIKHVILLNDVSSEGSESLNEQGIQLHDFNTLLDNALPLKECYPTQANDPAYLVYTSGTTGYPKGVLHAHRALLGRTPSGKHWFDFNEDTEQQKDHDRILHSGKFNWTYVLGTALMDPMYHGKTVVVYEGKNDVSTWINLIAKHQCTIFIGVPTIYRQIIQKTDFSLKEVPTLRHCMCAGEHLSDEVLLAWSSRFKQDIYEAIGMSECSYYISHNKSQAIRPGSAGIPQPGHDIALIDDNGKPVGINEEGMIAIPLVDPGLFIEYWGLKDETQKSRNEKYFLTGDYASQDEEGYIWFLGRKDDIINSFGYRISPHEIERILKTHPAIADAVAIEEAVGKDKSIVSACVILHSHNKQSTSEESLISFCEEHLAQYKVPKKIVFMTAFPRTKNGKVLRKQIKQDLSS